MSVRTAILSLIFAALIAALIFGLTTNWKTKKVCMDVSHPPYRICEWITPRWHYAEKVNPKRNIILAAAVLGVGISLVLTNRSTSTKMQ